MTQSSATQRGSEPADVQFERRPHPSGPGGPSPYSQFGAIQNLTSRRHRKEERTLRSVKKL